jgi:hypothetical protein
MMVHSPMYIMQNRAWGTGTPTDSAASNTQVQTSNHSISFVGIKMRSSQYAAPRQDTDTGGGVSGVQGGGLLPEVWLSRPRCVYKPFVERFPSRQAPLTLKGLFCGYNDLQEGFEALWNTWLGVGIGIWDSSAVRSGGCGGLASPFEILSLLSQTR